jgi:hypothetical protein
MRKLALLITIGSFSTFLLTSCTKSDESISSDDAALVIGTALSSQDGAFSLTETDITAQNNSALKSAASPTTANTSPVYSTVSYTKDTTGTKTDGTRTWKFSRSYTLTLKLLNITTIDSLISIHTDASSFDGPSLSSTDKSTCNVIFSNIGSLLNVNTYWTLNGLYYRSGTSLIKSSKKTITQTTYLVLKNVTFNHKTKLITGGTATVTIKGSASGSSFSFTGTLTLNGDTTAKLVLGTKTYIVNLITGEIKI